jgi:hypothetical protein
MVLFVMNGMAFLIKLPFLSVYHVCGQLYTMCVVYTCNRGCIGLNNKFSSEGAEYHHYKIKY